MEAIELLRTRRSVVVRNLSGPGPSKDQLNAIIEAGLRVPDHGKIGPWRIQIITEKGQKKLGDIFSKAFKKSMGTGQQTL